MKTNKNQWKVTQRIELPFILMGLLGFGLMGAVIYDSVGTGYICAAIVMFFSYKWEWVGKKE